MEYVITSLLSIILTLAIWRLKDWLSYKINPDIKLRKAPRNIFKHIKPGVTEAKVKELLQAPYFDNKNSMIYKFKDVNIEIKKEKNRVKTIILILKKFGIRNKYHVHPTEHILGKVKLGELIENPENVGVNISSKHGEIWTKKYYGNPGYYWYYTFGIFDGPSANYPYDFPKFNSEEQKIYGDYEHLKANFVAISKDSDGQHFFDFYAMR